MFFLNAKICISQKKVVPLHPILTQVYGDDSCFIGADYQAKIVVAEGE